MPYPNDQRLIRHAGRSGMREVVIGMATVAA